MTHKVTLRGKIHNFKPLRKDSEGNPKDNFGFIRENPSEDIFFHFNDCRFSDGRPVMMKDLYRGREVQFTQPSNETHAIEVILFPE